VDNNVFRDAIGENIMFTCIRANWKKSCEHYRSPDTYDYWDVCAERKWMMFLILSSNFVVYFPILMLVDVVVLFGVLLYILIIYPPRSVYDSFRDSFRKRKQGVEEKDQERKRKFPISHLQNGLSELGNRGFNDRVVNAVLLEQYDYEMDKVLDRLADPTSETLYKNVSGGVKVHSFYEDNLAGKEKKFLFSQKTVLMSNCSEQLRLQRTKRPQGRARKIHEFLTSSSPLSEAVQEPLKGNEASQQYCHISLILHEPSRIQLGSGLSGDFTLKDDAML
jgi:hypothetical protein